MSDDLTPIEEAEAAVVEILDEAEGVKLPDLARIIVARVRADLTRKLCQLGYCDRDAVVAVHHLSDSSVLFRTDHLTEPFISDWRCVDCAVEALEGFVGMSHSFCSPNPQETSGDQTC